MKMYQQEKVLSDLRCTKLFEQLQLVLIARISMRLGHWHHRAKEGRHICGTAEVLVLLIPMCGSSPSESCVVGSFTCLGVLLFCITCLASKVHFLGLVWHESNFFSGYSSGGMEYALHLPLNSTFHERTEHLRDNLRKGITGVVHLQLAQQAAQFIC